MTSERYILIINDIYKMEEELEEKLTMNPFKFICSFLDIFLLL